MVDNMLEIKSKNKVGFQRVFTKYGEINKNLPRVYRDALGNTASDIIVRRDKLIDKKKEVKMKKEQLIADYNDKKENNSLEINRLNEQVILRKENVKEQTQQKKDDLTDEQLNDYNNYIEEEEIKLGQQQAVIDTLERENKVIDTNKLRNELDIEQLDDEVERLEEKNEEQEGRLTPRERVILVFKKYGVTLTAIVTSVSIVLGVIISSLKSGLTTLASGVGRNLKIIGEKLAQILPGMVGAIASFVFKTASQVIGFIGKHLWLLIIAVVMYFVERYKKKK